MDRKMTEMIHVSQFAYAGDTKNDRVETKSCKDAQINNLDFIGSVHPQCKITILIAHLCYHALKV